MKYPENIPPELLSQNASNGMLLFSAVLGVIIGCLLMYMGAKGKIMWLRFWGGGLIICSIVMSIFILK